MASDKAKELYIEERIKEIEVPHSTFIVFNTDAEIGFGRQCMGLLLNMHDKRGTEHFLAYNNPMWYLPKGDSEDAKDYINRLSQETDDRLDPPDNVRAYHKDNFFAVLYEGREYSEVLEEMYRWILNLHSHRLEVVIKHEAGDVKSLHNLFFHETHFPIIRIKK